MSGETGDVSDTNGDGTATSATSVGVLATIAALRKFSEESCGSSGAMAESSLWVMFAD
jgi:hypothetical protein